MDSLTQIVLGGAVGEAVLGKKVGNKAVFWGAVGGTIPDLDTIPGYMMDTVSRLDIHRGFSHSIVFAILISPLLGLLLGRLYRKRKETDWKGWTQLMFWAIFTHPLLDIFTTWGTQLFWPAQWRIAIQSIFVIDPLYTLPFLFCLIAVLFYNRKNKKRRKWNRWGLILSSTYLLLSLVLKTYADYQWTQKLKANQIEYLHFDSRPTPFNTLLWTFNIEQEEQFSIAYYSLLDKGDKIHLRSFPKNETLLLPYRNNPDVEKLIFLTKGQYVIEKENDGILMHDLRFGLIDGLDSENKNFAFTYRIQQTEKGILITEKEKSFKGMDKAMSHLWNRIWKG